MLLSELRALVRRDLMDEECPQRFTDGQIDRALQRAVNELSLYSPRPMLTDLKTTRGTRVIAVTELSPRISIEKVEFPAGMCPERFIRFSLTGDMLIMEVPGDGSDCRVYWSSMHVVDEDHSTVPAHLEDIVVLGATAYAALSLSQYTTDKTNIGGENVDRDYLYWAKGRLLDFQSALRRLKSKVKVQRTYMEE